MNVIIDATGIKGDFLQWMAESVKAADAIILLLTPKYEQSVNCGVEAKFAHDRKKKIIPLVGERGYAGGDGWLAMLIADKIRYNVVDDFDTSMANILLRELVVVPKPLDLSRPDPLTEMNEAAAKRHLAKIVDMLKRYGRTDKDVAYQGCEAIWNPVYNQFQ